MTSVKEAKIEVLVELTLKKLFGSNYETYQEEYKFLKDFALLCSEIRSFLREDKLNHLEIYLKPFNAEKFQTLYSEYCEIYIEQDAPVDYLISLLSSNYLVSQIFYEDGKNLIGDFLETFFSILKVPFETTINKYGTICYTLRIYHPPSLNLVKKNKNLKLREIYHQKYLKKEDLDFELVSSEPRIYQIHSIMIRTLNVEYASGFLNGKMKESREKKIVFSTEPSEFLEALIDYLYLGRKRFLTKYLEIEMEYIDLYQFAHRLSIDFSNVVLELIEQNLFLSEEIQDILTRLYELYSDDVKLKQILDNLQPIPISSIILDKFSAYSYEKILFSSDQTKFALFTKDKCQIYTIHHNFSSDDEDNSKFLNRETPLITPRVRNTIEINSDTILIDEKSEPLSNLNNLVEFLLNDSKLIKPSNEVAIPEVREPRYYKDFQQIIGFLIYDPNSIYINEHLLYSERFLDLKFRVIGNEGKEKVVYSLPESIPEETKEKMINIFQKEEYYSEEEYQNLQKGKEIIKEFNFLDEVMIERYESNQQYSSFTIKFNHREIEFISYLDKKFFIYQNVGDILLAMMLLKSISPIKTEVYKELYLKRSINFKTEKFMINFFKGYQDKIKLWFRGYHKVRIISMDNNLIMINNIYLYRSKNTIYYYNPSDRPYNIINYFETSQEVNEEIKSLINEN